MEAFCDEKNIIYYPIILDAIRYVIAHCRREKDTASELMPKLSIEIDNMQPLYGQTITAITNFDKKS